MNYTHFVLSGSVAAGAARCVLRISEGLNNVVLTSIGKVCKISIYLNISLETNFSFY